MQHSQGTPYEILPGHTSFQHLSECPQMVYLVVTFPTYNTQYSDIPLLATFLISKSPHTFFFLVCAGAILFITQQMRSI